MTTQISTSPPPSFDPVMAYEEQMRRVHRRAQSAFLNGNLPVVLDCLQDARLISAAARREAKKVGQPKAADHTVWMKNMIASMGRVLDKRQS